MKGLLILATCLTVSYCQLTICPGPKINMTDHLLAIKNGSLDKDVIKDQLFDISGPINEQQYLLSKGPLKNISVAKEICEVYGGYLAEVIGADERRDVKKFIDDLNIPIECLEDVLISALNDCKEEWLEFAVEPDVTMCLTMKRPNHDINSIHCFDHKDTDVHILCEIDGVPM